jgi:hypothetical protein
VVRSAIALSTLVSVSLIDPLERSAAVSVVKLVAAAALPPCAASRMPVPPPALSISVVMLRSIVPTAESFVPAPLTA